MTWLFSFYWFGALAVAGPVLFHMWRRTPRGQRPFSTLMFLTPSPPRMTSRSRIEHWMLLLLRAASLALLAFAFTRPLWRTPIQEIESSSHEQLLAILIDTSASLKRETLWNDLIGKLDERLSQLPPETSVALYRFDRQFAAVVDFRETQSMEISTRREIVRERLKELKPTWEQTDLGEALIRTAAALQEAQSERTKPAPQRIWLATDLQSGAETVAIQGYEWPEDLPVDVILARPASPSNAGLQVVERNVETGTDVLRVRVTNSADSVKEELTLKWDSPSSTEVSVYVPPGQSRTVIPPPRVAGEASSVLHLLGDDHDFDNRVYIADRSPDKRRVLYCGLEPASDTNGARFYLEQVFSSSHRYQVDLQEFHESNFAAAESQPALIILIQPEIDAQPMIRRHLANGGTVVVASPTIETMQASLSLCGREDLLIAEATVVRYAMLAEIDFTHPVFAPFAESQFGDFTGIRFWKHRTVSGLRVAAANPDETTDVLPTAHDHVLARFDDGQPAIVELIADRGQVLLFAAGWQPADSQFARSSKFPMLMFRLLERSAGVTQRPDSQAVGTAITWPATTNLESGSTGSVMLPDGKQITLLPIDRPFSQTDSPGLYNLHVPGRTEQIAINLAANESRTAPLSLEQLESYGLKLSAHERPQVRLERQRQLQLTELEQTQKLWQIILTIVIIVLAIETYFSGRFSFKDAQ